MRMQYVETWTEMDMGRHLAKDIARSGIQKLTWFRVSDGTVVCQGVDSLGRDRIGSCSFRSASDFDAVVACKLSLFDATIRGNGCDADSSRGTEPELEAV
jgi:hypothetical protein